MYCYYLSEVRRTKNNVTLGIPTANSRFGETLHRIELFRSNSTSKKTILCLRQFYFRIPQSTIQLFRSAFRFGIHPFIIIIYLWYIHCLYKKGMFLQLALSTVLGFHCIHVMKKVFLLLLQTIFQFTVINPWNENDMDRCGRHKYPLYIHFFANEWMNFILH